MTPHNANKMQMQNSANVNFSVLGGPTLTFHIKIVCYCLFFNRCLEWNYMYCKWL